MHFVDEASNKPEVCVIGLSANQLITKKEFLLRRLIKA